MTCDFGYAPGREFDVVVGLYHIDIEFVFAGCEEDSLINA